MPVTILAAFLGSEIGRRGQQGQAVQGAATKSLWASDASCGKDTSGSSGSKRFGTGKILSFTKLDSFPNPPRPRLLWL